MEHEEEEDLSFVPIIKKRTKGIRPSSSSSSFRTLSLNDTDDSSSLKEATTPPSRTKDDRVGGRITASSLAEDEISLIGEESNHGLNEGDGNVAIVRPAWRKTPVGRMKQRENGGMSRSSAERETTKTRLSFGGLGEEEEDEGPTVIRRSGDSPRRLLRPMKSSTSLLQKNHDPTNLIDRANLPSPASPVSGLPSSSSSSGIYSKEHLAELQAGTMSTPKALSTTPINAADVEEYDDLTRSKFGTILNGTGPSSLIPTSATIQEAREKREQMRLHGDTIASQDNFVSLTVGHAVKGDESRLVREEDEIGDGDDDLAAYTGANELVPLGKKANKAAAQKLKSGMAELIQEAEEEDAEDEEDEESREWELAQVRRGGHADRHYGESNHTRSGETSLKKSAPIPQTSVLPTLTGVSLRLSTAVDSLEASHTLDSAALDHFAKERQELDRQETELRAEVERTGKRNRWYGDFKVFVEEIAAFLDEKMPLLEKIERENLSIQKERFQLVSKRRFEDDSDDVALFTGAQVPTSFRIDTGTAGGDNDESDDQDEEREESEAEDEDEDEEGDERVDELGRSRREDDTAVMSAVRKARRASRRMRSKTHSDSLAHTPQAIIAAATNGTNEEEELWTDDELSTSDAQDLASALASLRESLANLFSDVKADDFRDPNLGIRKKFEEWRSVWTEDYTNAFGGLALVGVWEFWARVEMALWNPFEIAQMDKSPVGLDAYAWHSSLAAYGHEARHVAEREQEADGAASMLEEDESETVVNGLVTLVVLPRLEKLARDSFDPLSRKQTKRAIDLLDEVSYCVEVKSPRFETLVQAFLYRIQLQVSSAQSLIAPHLSALTLPATFIDPSLAIAARHRFLRRQVKLLANALKWKRYAKGIVLGQHLHHLGGGTHAKALQGSRQDTKDPLTLAGAGDSFEQLLSRELVAKVILPVIEAGWSTGGQDIAQNVIRMLPQMNPALQRRLQGEAVVGLKLEDCDLIISLVAMRL